MEKIKIMALSAGGPATLSFCRSLRLSNIQCEIFGLDADPFNLMRAEVDHKILCPKHTDINYVSFLINVIKEENINYLHPQSESDVYFIGLNRDKLSDAGCQIFLPTQYEIELFRDKGKSQLLWENAGIKVPKNISIQTEDDLRNAFDTFGKEIWIRETIGAAGKGSLSRPTFEEALSHIVQENSWGRVVAAEHLSKDTVTWQSVWFQGDLIACQGRKRLNWAFGDRTQSGVTGLTGVGETFASNDLDAIAKKCIQSANINPHGIYSVDFTYDHNGEANPTEINIGKFFTTHMFLSSLGANMPELIMRLLYDNEKPNKLINPCPNGYYWIRGIDIEPKLVSVNEIESIKESYEHTLSNFSD